MSRTSEMRKRTRAEINALKVERGCQDCGNKHPAVLDWHHLEERKGGKCIPQLISETVSKERLMTEIAKCVVLCANCHRIRHYAT